MKAVAAIETRGLIKDFPLGLRGVKVRAVDELSLRVEAGQVFGLLGPNGSGKSTTIKIVLDLLAPTAGECALFGVPCHRVEARSQVGYLPESPHFYRHLCGRELVSFYGGLCGLKGRELQRQTDEVIAWVGLAGAAERPVRTYSKGMLQRIGIAQAIVHDPRLVILDEPMAGIDPVGVAEIAALIQRLKTRGKTVVIVSHLLAQVEEFCDRIAILERGRLIFQGAVSEIEEAAQEMTLQVDRLSAEQVEELRAWLVARGGKLKGIGPVRTRLDSLFAHQVAAARETSPL